MSYILYAIAVLLVFIPISIVLTTEITFSSYFSKIILSISLACVIVGKILTVLRKSKNDKSLPKDVGIIIGLLITLILRLLK